MMETTKKDNTDSGNNIKASKKINLALQGGSSPGVFWTVC